jgi:L-methionine (R)-S-oxide reductase
MEGQRPVIAEVQLNDSEKRELYESVISLMTKEEREYPLSKDDLVPRLATIAAILKEKMPHYLWCGFYFAEEKEMLVGPYQGVLACPNIGYDGVCGEAAKKKETVIVPDVHAFEGHITCDERSQSEIVVPMMRGDDVIGVFDVDSQNKDGFNEVDKEYLERIVGMLLKD